MLGETEIQPAGGEVMSPLLLLFHLPSRLRRAGPQPPQTLNGDEYDWCEVPKNPPPDLFPPGPRVRNVIVYR